MGKGTLSPGYAPINPHCKQWGEDGSVTSTIHNITFPISFTGQPTVIPAVTTTDSSFITLTLRSTTSTGARIDGSLAFKWVSWFAIGY